MSIESKAPTIDERYTSATNTSNLKVELDRRNVADVLIAAGWSRAKLGVAMLRLQAEWDGAEKPRALSNPAVKVLAGTFKPEKDGKVDYRTTEGLKRLAPMEAAKLQANEWHMHELGMLFQKLKTLSEVRERVAEFAWLKNMESPHMKGAAVVSWWLHHTCPVCGGGKWEVIPGTNRHSARACAACKGTGNAEIPHGWEGRRLLSEMDEALNAARGGMGSATRVT